MRTWKAEEAEAKSKEESLFVGNGIERDSAYLHGEQQNTKNTQTSNEQQPLALNNP